MKIKLISLFLFMSIFISYAAGDDSVNLIFTVSGPELLRNDHVGNDWATDLYVVYRKKKYSLMGTSSDPVNITVLKKSGFLIKAYAIEHDKSPDYGKKSKFIKVSDILKNGSGKYELIVSVRENRGRYSGRLAQWRFMIEVTIRKESDS